MLLELDELLDDDEDFLLFLGAPLATALDLLELSDEDLLLVILFGTDFWSGF